VGEEEEEEDLGEGEGEGEGEGGGGDGRQQSLMNNKIDKTLENAALLPQCC